MSNKSKPPSFPLYVKDVLSDTELQMSDEITRGIWFNYLCHMWIAKEQGKLEGTIEQLIKLGNTTPEKMIIFISDAIEFEFCDLHFFCTNFAQEFVENGGAVTDMSRFMSQEITVINRRIYRVENKRKSDRERKRRSRALKKSRRMSRESHNEVTPEKAAPAFPSSSAVQDLSKDKSETDDHKVSPANLPPSEAAGADDLPFSIPDQKSENKHFSAKVGEHFDAIKASCDAIQKLPQRNGKRFNPFQFVQKHVNEGRHPGAISETVKAMSDPKYFAGIRGDPFAYGNSILKTKNQNWNEREAVKIHEDLKAMTIPELKQLTHGIMKEFG